MTKHGESNKKKTSQFNDQQAKKMTLRVMRDISKMSSGRSPMCQAHHQNDAQVIG